MDPFLIPGPAVVSFSGGLTSAYMLHRILDSYGGKLPPDVHVLFANTGKERNETLDFVRECASRWGVVVTWLEFRSKIGNIDSDTKEDRDWLAAWRDWSMVREVDYFTASRDGRPFMELIRSLRFLPNPVARICTQEMKVRTFKRWMIAHGYDHWTNVVGLRADEPERVARMRAGEGREVWDVALPLAEGGVLKSDIQKFWGGRNLGCGC